MQDNGKSAIWEPGELIYEAGNEATEAYLILEGYVNIETKDGLKLNRLGMGEIFGETSILLNVQDFTICVNALIILFSSPVSDAIIRIFSSFTRYGLNCIGLSNVSNFNS